MLLAIEIARFPRASGAGGSPVLRPRPVDARVHGPPPPGWATLSPGLSIRPCRVRPAPTQHGALSCKEIATRAPQGRRARGGWPAQETAPPRCGQALCWRRRHAACELRTSPYVIRLIGANGTGLGRFPARLGRVGLRGRRKNRAATAAAYGRPSDGR